MPKEYDNKKLYYTDRERFEYNAKRMKKGAINKDGEVLSDYARGVAAGKNAEMKKQYRRFKAKNPNYKKD